MAALSPYLPFMLSGIWTTLLVLVLSAVIMMAFALLAGTARLSPRWYVSGPVTALVEFLRGTSAIVQLFWAFYVLPLAGISLSPIVTAVIVLGLNEGSYASEIVRSGIKSVPAGQHEAAVALNLGRRRRFWRIIFPQAVPFMIPPLGNTLINLAKLTSLSSLVTVSDLTFRAQSIRDAIGQTTPIFVILLLSYFVISLIISGLTVLAERKARARFGGSADSGGPPSSWQGLLRTARTLRLSQDPLKQLEGAS
jgi:polar amino acid transport system permease protein